MYQLKWKHSEQHQKPKKFKFLYNHNSLIPNSQIVINSWPGGKFIFEWHRAIMQTWKAKTSPNYCCQPPSLQTQIKFRTIYTHTRLWLERLFWHFTNTITAQTKPSQIFTILRKTVSVIINKFLKSSRYWKSSSSLCGHACSVWGWVGMNQAIVLFVIQTIITLIFTQLTGMNQHATLSGYSNLYQPIHTDMLAYYLAP